MPYVYPAETAAGVVNGINKIFTTASNIYMISYIVVDGIIYVGNVSFVAGTNSFTLQDAPAVLSPEIVYYNSVPSLPTGTSITVAECRAEFLKRKKDTSDIDSISGTFLQWCNYLNRFAYRELASTQPEQYLKSYIYSLSAPQVTYGLPSDFQDINPQGTGFYLIDQDGKDTDVRLPITGFGSTQKGFYMNSSAVSFTPIPNDTVQYRLRYVPLLSELTSETDQMLIPKRFSMFIMDYLDSVYALWDEDNNAEVFNDARVVRTLTELLTHIKPDGQVAVLPDFSGDYYF
jgi:hypothetical protein